MAEKWEIQYLEMLREAFVEKIPSATIEEYEQQPCLSMSFDSPVNENDIIGMSITIEHILENTEQLEIFTGMFTGYDEKYLGEIEKVVLKLNEFLDMGHIGIFYASNQIFYNYAFPITKEMDVALVTALLQTSLNIIIPTIVRAMEILHPVVIGEKTADELLKEDVSLLQ